MTLIIETSVFTNIFIIVRKCFYLKGYIMYIGYYLQMEIDQYLCWTLSCVLILDTGLTIFGSII